MLDRNAAPDTKDDSSPTEYSKAIFTEFVVTLLVEELSMYCYQSYIVQATSSLSPLVKRQKLSMH